MSAVSSAPTQRSLLAPSAAAGALGLVLLAAPSYAQTVPARPTKRHAAAEADAVRPFRINVPEAALYGNSIEYLSKALQSSSE